MPWKVVPQPSDLIRNVHNMCLEQCISAIGLQAASHLRSQLPDKKVPLLLQGDPARTQPSTVTLPSVQPCTDGRKKKVASARPRLSVSHIANLTGHAIKDLTITLDTSKHHQGVMNVTYQVLPWPSQHNG